MHDGHYKWLKMPFGLTNGSAVFQKIMTKILGPLLETTVKVYLDHILISYITTEEGLQKLKDALHFLQKLQMKLQLEKCLFLSTRISYLSHVISEEGVHPGDTKS